MALRTREFNTLKEAELFFQGAIRGGKQIANASGLVYNLHDKTLIFTSPASVTVTFDEDTGDANSNGLGNGLTPQQIRNQIVAAVAALSPFFLDKVLNLVETTPTSGVAITEAGTANKLLGFSGATATTGTIINPPGGGAPALVSLQPKSNFDGYYAVINE